MKVLFPVLIVVLVFVSVAMYVKVNVLDVTGAVSASMSGVVHQPVEEQPSVDGLKSSGLFALWAVLVLAVTLFFFIRIVRLGA